MSEASAPPTAPTTPSTERERQYAARIAYLEEQLALITSSVEGVGRAIRENQQATKQAISDAFALIQAQIDRKDQINVVH